MFKKIATFIKYNTLTTIIIAVAFIAVASAVASNEDVKKNIIGEEIVETQGVDNTLLLAADLEEFDLEMKIMDVFQDDENYYVDYQFNTLGIQDDVWQEIFNQSQLVVSIESLEGRDLGLYIMEELGEVIDYEIAYLKEVQENEEEKGETFVVETTIYTGLIGLVLDTKTKELPGYEPVVKPIVSEEIIFDDDVPYPGYEIPPAPFVKGGDDDVPFDERGSDDYVEDSYYYEFLINNCLDNGGYWYNNTCNAEAEIVIPVCGVDNLELCITQELCEEISLYWYDEICNLEEETLEEDLDDVPVCDLDNLDLCITQDLCEGISLYWYDEVCNVLQDGSTQSMEPTPSAFTCDADHPTLCDAEEICVDMELYWYEGECHLEEEVIDEVPSSVAD